MNEPYSSSSKRVLEDPKIILGFFREALFQSRRVEVIGISSEASEASEAIEFLITDIPHGDQRDPGPETMLVLTPCTNEPEASGTTFQFKCRFPQFLALWEGTLSRRSDGQFEGAIPPSLTLLNSRRHERLKPLSDPSFATVTVQGGGMHSLGKFQLEDVSRYGAGGVLQCPKELPLLRDSPIHGRLSLPSGSLSIRGSVVQVQLIGPTLSTPPDFLYRVGIRLDSAEAGVVDAPPVEETKIQKNPERRRSSRIPADFDLNLVSPLHSGHLISFQVTDAGASGFRGMLREAVDAKLLPAGCSVSVGEGALQALLVSIDGRELRFQITGGGPEDRLAWLKRLTPYLHPQVSGKSAFGAEIMDLFCESGALAVGYLKNTRTVAEAFEAALGGGGLADEPWIHRWIERTDSGEIRGHISAVRVADNLWHLGDIAGMIEENRKVSRKFIPAFFSSFLEYCLHTRPCPRILIGWKAGHPYWRAFENFIEQHHGASRSAVVHTQYFRLPYSKVREASSSRRNHYREIRAFDFESILEIQRELEKLTIAPELRQIVQALDFDIDRFGSPSLSRILQPAGRSLDRRYFLLEEKAVRALVIFHAFPNGSSPQDTLNVPWLIPLPVSGAFSSNPQEIQALVEASQDLGIQAGYSFPGILVVEPRTGVETAGAAKQMRWTLGHPGILKFFDSHE
jgi:hypothetical protein